VEVDHLPHLEELVDLEVVEVEKQQHQRPVDLHLELHSQELLEQLRPAGGDILEDLVLLLQTMVLVVAAGLVLLEVQDLQQLLVVAELAFNFQQHLEILHQR
jgi:hypothetical protein